MKEQDENPDLEEVNKAQIDALKRANEQDAVKRKEEEEKRKEEEKQRLIARANESDESRFLDENLDKVNERSTLISDPKLQPYIGKVNPYQKKVPLVFYYLIYKLNGWDTSGNKLYRRPGIVGRWTNGCISEVLITY